MWRDILKFTIEHETTYWEYFKDKCTTDDFAQFIDEIVIPNPSLSKITLFTFFPEIQRNIHDYPIKEKIEQLNHITETDKQVLYELMNTEKGKIGDHLEFLNETYGIVRATVNNKCLYPDIPLEKIFLFNSYYRMIRLRSPTGIVKLIRSIGKYYPVYWLIFESTQRGEEIERICHMNFIKSRPNLNKERDEWEKFSGSAYQKFNKYPDKDNMLFGIPIKPNHPMEPHDVIYYFRGEKLSFPYTKRGSFIFPIGQRYQPLIGKELWRAEKDLKLVEQSPRGRKYWKRKLEEVVRDAVKSWEEKKGLLPPYIKLNVKGYNTSQFRSKSHSTTTVEKPCTETMLEVWMNCRYKRPKDKDNAYCERRKNGFCTWPEAKRKIYTRIEKSENEEVSKKKIDKKQFNEWHDDQSQDTDQSYLWEKLEELASDNTDIQIIECLKTGEYSFRKSKLDININYSAIARQVNVSYKTVKRRFEKMVTNIKK